MHTSIKIVQIPLGQVYLHGFCRHSYVIHSSADVLRISVSVVGGFVLRPMTGLVFNVALNNKLTTPDEYSTTTIIVYRNLVIHGVRSVGVFIPE